MRLPRTRMAKGEERTENRCKRESEWNKLESERRGVHTLASCMSLWLNISLHAPSGPRPIPTLSSQCREFMCQSLLVPRLVLLAILPLTKPSSFKLYSLSKHNKDLNRQEGLHRDLIEKSETEYVNFPKD